MKDNTSFDILIVNATLIDGSGEDGFNATLCIKDGLIVDLIKEEEEEQKGGGGREGGKYDFSADKVIDASGMIVCPGFIDTHTHDDLGLLHEGGSMLPKISQGVSTVIVGNCGLSISPLTVSASLKIVDPLPLIGPEKSMWKYQTTEQYIKDLERQPPSINYAILTGHISLKLDAMQDSDEILKRGASGKELDHMKLKLRESLQAGSIGLSTGLFYDPSRYSPTSEIINLSSVLPDYKGIYVSHIRNEAEDLEESVKEAILIGNSNHIPVVISHFKAAGKHNWGKVKKALSLVSDANALNDNVAIDVYPYVAGSTVLNWDNIDKSERVIISNIKNAKYQNVVGKDLNEIVKQFGGSLEECVKEISPAGGIFFLMNEEDVQSALKFPKAMIGSDGIFFDSHPHPRLYGTFPKVLNHYTKSQPIFTLPEAIRKMTSLPASVFHLHKRGLIKKSYYADITIFNYNTIRDNSTWTEPTLISSGIEYVIVNGRVAFENGKVTKERSGKLLGVPNGTDKFE